MIRIPWMEAPLPPSATPWASSKGEAGGPADLPAQAFAERLMNNDHQLDPDRNDLPLS
jgi:hypothetical protein